MNFKEIYHIFLAASKNVAAKGPGIIYYIKGRTKEKISFLLGRNKMKQSENRSCIHIHSKA